MLFCTGWEKDKAISPALPPQWACRQESKLHLRKRRQQPGIAELHHWAPDNVSPSLQRTLTVQLAQPVNGTRGMLWTIWYLIVNYLFLQKLAKALATLRLIRLLKELRNHNQYFRANSLIRSKWLAFALHWQNKEGKEILLPDSQVSGSRGIGDMILIEIYYTPAIPS